MLNRISVCILIFFTLELQAQIMLGIKGGINLNSVSVDTRNIDYTQSELLPGLNIGVAADFGLTHYLSIKTELLFSQKGYAERKYRDADYFTAKNELYSDSWSHTNNYLELPVLANYFYEGRKLKLFLNAGVYGAYWMNGTESASFFTNDLGSFKLSRKDVESAHVFDNTYGNDKKVDMRFDFGVIGGVGLGIRIKNGWLNFETRYNYGLVDMNSFKGDKPKSYSGQYNSNLSFSVSYVMLLKPGKNKKENSAENEEQKNSGQ